MLYGIHKEFIEILCCNVKQLNLTLYLNVDVGNVTPGDKWGNEHKSAIIK